MRTTEAVGFQWRPVENAPKDGREILVVTRHDEYRVCQWDADFGWCDLEFNRFEPSVWMPLPPRPRPSGGKVIAVDA
jgi:hypothetical protein